jgi:uncharacterized protein YqhQ
MPSLFPIFLALSSWFLRRLVCLIPTLLQDAVVFYVASELRKVSLTATLRLYLLILVYSFLLGSEDFVARVFNLFICG